MSNLHAKLKLKNQTFLFGEKFALRKNREIVVDMSKLNVADLEIIANQIKQGIVESNIPADKFVDRAFELRQKVKVGDVEEVFNLQTVEDVRVLDAEIELDDGTVVTQSELDEMSKHDPRKDFIQEKIIDSSSAPALVAIKNIPDVDVGILEYAINTEAASKNRKSIISALKSELASLTKEDEAKTE